MPGLPGSPGQSQFALERQGFIQVWQRRSFVVLHRDAQEKVTGCVVPLHVELATGTLGRILKQAGVPPEEFAEQLCAGIVSVGGVACSSVSPVVPYG
jgi:predicted RNA binding protein YcfA (HicA-like mRNA interferase family)